jgi:hypothetical protein
MRENWRKDHHDIIGGLFKIKKAGNIPAYLLNGLCLSD